MTKSYKIPFDKVSGDLLHYAGYSESPHYDWRTNYFFSDTLTLTRMERGRSAKYVVWMDKEGRAYPMFIRDLVDLLTHHKVTKGRATGQWTFQKRGQNFGIKLHTGWDGI